MTGEYQRPIITNACPLKRSRNHCTHSLQSRRFLTKTRRYIDRGRHLEKQRKRLRGRGGGIFLNPSTSPLKTLFDSSQLSGSINVQDGGTTSFLKTIHGSRSKIRLLCRLLHPKLVPILRRVSEVRNKRS